MSEEQSSNKINCDPYFKNLTDGVNLEKLIYDTFEDTFKKINLHQVNFANIDKVREQSKEVTRHYNDLFNNLMKECNKQQGEK